MDDVTFIAKLRASAILPTYLKVKIKSMPTSAEKANYFLDQVILPNVNDDHSNLDTLLSVMENFGYPLLNKLAVEIGRCLYTE